MMRRGFVVTHVKSLYYMMLFVQLWPANRDTYNRGSLTSYIVMI